MYVCVSVCKCVWFIFNLDLIANLVIVHTHIGIFMHGWPYYGSMVCCSTPPYLPACLLSQLSSNLRLYNVYLQCLWFCALEIINIFKH